MNFNLSDEQDMLADGAARYARARYDFETRRGIIRDQAGFSPQHWREYAEMGWLALGIGEADGGLGGSATDLALLLERLGEALPLEPLVDTAVLGVRLLSASADGSERAALLAAVASGEKVLALAHLERQSRHEYEWPVQTRASRTADGWVLEGRKHRIRHGADAHTWLVSAQIEGQPDFGIFAVDAGSTGARVIDRYRLIDGSFAIDLALDQVGVADTALLLPPETAPAALEQALDHALVAQGAAAVGSMEAVLAMTSDYLKTRVQYGKPLAQFQALQHRMSEMFVETDQARSILYAALSALDGDDAQRRRFAVSAAKVVIARAWLFVAGQGIQLHGGIGTTEEYAVGHHYKAAVAFDQRYGDNGFHLDRAGSDLRRTGEPLRGALHA
jgi:alkylation response protein AidB-like acyl-CoA dehydrogenase